MLKFCKSIFYVGLIALQLNISRAEYVTLFFVKVNPSGTYLKTAGTDVTYGHGSGTCSYGYGGWGYGFYNCSIAAITPGPATELDLTALYNDPNLNLKAGDSLSFEMVGDFSFSLFDLHSDNGKSLTAVFLGDNGLISPGSATTAPIATTSSDIPYDFEIPPDRIVSAQIPNGATKLLFSVNDIFFSDNRDFNNNFGVNIKIKVNRQKFTKKVIGEIDPNIIRMTPSVKSSLACNNSELLSIRKFILHCENPDGTFTNKCKVKFTLRGVHPGGHNHEGEHPLGHLTDNSGVLISQNIYYNIPKAGFVGFYRAPEIAGGGILDFDVKDLDDNIVDSIPTSVSIRSEQDYSKIVISGLTFVNIFSHPGDGDFGLPETITRMNALIRDYKIIAEKSSVPKDYILSLKSEAASLSWGGLFDINKDWKTPHCGHRNGKTLDLSMSNLNNSIFAQRLKDALAESIVNNGFTFYGLESPSNPNASHWHISW